MKKKKGLILPIIIVTLVLLSVIIPALIKLISQDMRSSVSEQKRSIAFNLAQAAVERGYWKAKSSTTTFNQVLTGGTLAGYNFDTTYSDISGGYYRIKLSSGPSGNQITIIGEGKDLKSRETRAIKVIYQNTTITGAVISGSHITMADKATVHWGPIEAWGNIILSSSQQNQKFPRKFSKQGINPYDMNNNPPNTDNVEWWSFYDVPELPQFDFATMKSSAQANGTYNCGASSSVSPNSSNGYTTPCNCSSTQCKVSNIYADKRYNSGLIWYWDEDKKVTLDNTGLKGTMIVRGDLTITGDDCYGPWYKINGYDAYGGYHTCGQGKSTESGPGALFVKVPNTAYLEYAKIDSTATNEYPGDLGISSSALTYQIGSCGSSQYYSCNSACENNCEKGATGDDIGLYGFLYVGGNLQINGAFDLYGAAWVVGNFNTGSSNNMSIFFDENLSLPTLNVILIRQSWQEISPSTQNLV